MFAFTSLLKLKNRNTPKPKLQDEVKEPSLVVVNPEPEKLPDWVGDPISDFEKEMVSVISSAILADDRNHSNFKITKITPIDPDWIHAGIIASCVVAQEEPQSNCVIKRITRNH